MRPIQQSSARYPAATQSRLKVIEADDPDLEGEAVWVLPGEPGYDHHPPRGRMSLEPDPVE